MNLNGTDAEKKVTNAFLRCGFDEKSPEKDIQLQTVIWFPLILLVSSIPNPHHPTVTITPHTHIMDDPYEDRSMPADYGNNTDLDELDLEDMKPPQLDYYAVLNLSKSVRRLFTLV